METSPTRDECPACEECRGAVDGVAGSDCHAPSDACYDGDKQQLIWSGHPEHGDGPTYP